MGVRPQVFTNGLIMANLITASTYKDVMGITTSNADFQIGYYVDSVSQLVKTYCNNTFVDYVTTNKTEFFNINWSQTFVQLSESPVISVVSVKERDGITEVYKTLTVGTDFYLDNTTDTIFRSNGGTGYKNFPLGPGSVEVTYKAGYTDSGGNAEVPEDLRLAVIDLITYYYKDQSKARQTIAGASVQNTVTSSQRNNVAFPDHIKRVLDLYKNY